MKTLDTLSKRILVIAVSISLVLLSTSAFVLTIQQATAQRPAAQRPTTQTPVVSTPPVVGIGVSGNYLYYGVWNGYVYVLHSKVAVVGSMPIGGELD